MLLQTATLQVAMLLSAAYKTEKTTMSTTEQNRKRKRILLIRLDDKEYNTVIAKIAQTGLSRREFIYRAIIGVEIRKLHDIDGVEEEIRRIGVNINQIARKVNSLSAVEYWELKKLTEEVRKVWLLLKRLEVGHR